MIVEQGNKFQNIFIISVFKLIMAKNAAIRRNCCMGLYF